jgi:hypothetical protein
MNRTMRAENSRKLLRVKLIASKKRTHVELLDSLIKQRTSITALNTDSHSRRSIVKGIRRIANRTERSCGVAPSAQSGAAAAASNSGPHHSIDAGHAPAFSLRARRLRQAQLRGAEFISVSGLRPDRSALLSDVRPSKRTSGVAAATARPHAPMNSPSGPARSASGLLINLSSKPVRR